MIKIKTNERTLKTVYGMIKTSASKTESRHTKTYKLANTNFQYISIYNLI